MSAIAAVVRTVPVMANPGLSLSRPVMLTREGSVFRLAFRFDRALVELVQKLPYAHFDREDTKTWTVMVCEQSVQGLRNMFAEGLVDVYVDTLISPGEIVPRCKDATLRGGSAQRPYVVATATRNDNLYARLTSVTGAQWNKAASGITYPPGASVALAELAARGILDDPEGLLSPAATVVSFDGRVGKFVVRGDPRAQTNFDRFFPARDVVSLWQAKGLDVAFSDAFSEEIYRGELARVGPGIQPEGLAIPLFEHQQRNVAVAVQRTGLGIFDSPGIGKCLKPDTPIWVDGNVTAIGDLWQFAGDVTPADDGLGEWAVPTVPLEVYATDASGRQQRARVGRLFRQQVSERLRRVRLCDGSEVTITQAHHLLTADGWTNELRVGQKIAVPKRLDGRSGISVDADLVELLAWFVAEGYDSEDPSGGWSCYISQKDPQVLTRISQVAFRLIRAGVMVLSGKAWRRYLENNSYVLGQLLATRTIPSVIMQGDLATARLFLRHYFAVAGSIAGENQHVEISSASPVLMQQLTLLLRRLGIWMTIRETWKAAGNGTGIQRRYIAGLIAGEALTTFREKVGFADPVKQAKLDGFTLVDQASNNQASNNQASNNQASNNQAPDREEADTGPGRCLLVDSDLHFSEIAEIEDVEYSGYVYDLEVPEHHNFVAGGMVCHNTASGIGAGVAMLDRRLVTRAVIVVPGAVRTQWAQEIARFCGMPTDSHGMPISTDVVIITGDKRKRTQAYLTAREACWVVVNYDVLSRDYKLIAPLVSGAALILDEAHRIKNPAAQRTKAVKQLGARAARRLALSGTPMEKDPGEWFSLISGFLNPGVFGSYAEYGGRYQYPNAWGGYEGARNLGELRERSRVYFVRHTKDQVAKHLPPLRVQHMPIDPDPALATALRRAHKEAVDEIKMAALERTGKAVGGQVLDEDEDIETGAEMTAVQLLKAMTSSPRLVYLSDAPAARALVDAGLVPEVDGPKLDELRIMAAERQAAGERVVVFTYSRKMAELICQRLHEDGIRYVTYTGSSNSADRDAAVRAFTAPATDDDPGPTMFVATDAAAEGLNLGRCCSTLVNFDVPYTPARLEQRSNRIHRIDGTSPSYLVVNMTLTGTIEHGLLRMVETRADLQDAVFGEKGGRRKTTGRGGRSVFEQALTAWTLDVDPATLDGQFADAA